MKYRQLGKSGLVVSELALGTMTFGEGDFYGLNFTFDEKAARSLVNKALDLGINFFDTADMYGNGGSERLLGKALGTERKDAIISTKYSFRAGSQSFRAGVNAKHLIDQCENSLRAIGTDYLDVVLLHNDDPITPVDETLHAMEQMIESGKVRYIGLSNYSAWKTATMIQKQRDLNFKPFTVSQMHYSILNRDVEDEFIPMSLYHGLGMMVWSPLSSGFLTGKYTKENPKPDDSRLNSFDLGLFDREFGYEIVEQLIPIAKKYDTSLSALSIAWLLSKKVVSTVIIGVSKLHQLDTSIEASSLVLDQKDLDLIDTISKQRQRYPASFIGMQDTILQSAIRF